MYNIVQLYTNICNFGFFKNIFLKHLDDDDVMLLDTGSIIYVWIGHAANDNEKKEAQKTAEVIIFGFRTIIL